MNDSELFRKWWAVNHPLDWWRKERGVPLLHQDRLLVWDLCRKAYEAGQATKTENRTG